MKKKIIYLLIILLLIAGCICIIKNNKGILTTNEQLNTSQESEEKQEANETKEEMNNNQIVENTNSQENITNNEENQTTIVKQISPSGFMGSSFYKVTLYSNGDVYLFSFDGDGYEDSNIVSKELIAKKVTDINKKTDDEHYGEVGISGGELLNNNIGWITKEQ